jgi:hypothetical protein
MGAGAMESAAAIRRRAAIRRIMGAARVPACP